MANKKIYCNLSICPVFKTNLCCAVCRNVRDCQFSCDRTYDRKFPEGSCVQYCGGESVNDCIESTYERMSEND